MAKKPPTSHGPTIHDIAKAAGVSKSTVSLVLTRSPLAKPSTAAKVLEVAKSLGYVYNRSAANLRQRNSNVVGVIVNDLVNPFFVELLIGAERVLQQSGYITLMAHTAESLATQEKVLASMREQNAAGVILSPAFDSPSDLPERIQEWGLPLVVAVRSLGDNSRYDFVGSDNVSGMRLATQHLIAQGHRRIAFIGRKAGSVVSEERRSGYTSALAESGITPRPEWLIDAPVSLSGGQTALDTLLALPDRPTAVVCYNDLVAMGVLNELGRKGLQAGRDLAVVGFDNIASAAHSNPPLTTMDVTPERQGEIASRVLLDRIGRPDDAPRRHLIAPQLIVRASSVGVGSEIVVGG